eukprot:jgi/Botrbrau1/8762/Bobra.0090s0034.1
MGGMAGGACRLQHVHPPRRLAGAPLRKSRPLRRGWRTWSPEVSSGPPRRPTRRALNSASRSSQMTRSHVMLVGTAIRPPMGPAPDDVTSPIV